MVELKRLSPEAIPAALDKAVRYRLLNEPLQAESICRDILEVERENQEALIGLVLALTDQFQRRLAENFAAAQDVVERLKGDYEREYYRGIVFERRAHAHLRRGGHGSGHLAYEWFNRAMVCYDRAAELKPPGNDDAILRWNTCARLIDGQREIQPAPQDSFQPMLE